MKKGLSLLPVGWKPWEFAVPPLSAHASDWTMGSTVSTGHAVRTGGVAVKDAVGVALKLWVAVALVVNDAVEVVVKVAVKHAVKV